MGGHRGSKATTEDFHRLDVRYLSRNGYLRPGASFTVRWSRNEFETGSIQGHTTWNAVILSYDHQPRGSDEWQHEQYPVELLRTPCNYGGDRTWFRCPA
jgi:hypothetical protein